MNARPKSYNISPEYFLDLYGRMRQLYIAGQPISDDEIEEMCEMITCDCGIKEHDDALHATIRFTHGLLEACSPGNYPTVKEMRKTIKHGGGFYDRAKKLVVLHHHKK
jgi:hypothetical protein